MTERWAIKDGEIVDTETNMTFDSFIEILTVLNGQSRHLNELYEENQKLQKMNELLIAEIRWNREKTIKDKTRRITPKEYEEKKSVEF